jgi:hypothetical protein
VFASHGRVRPGRCSSHGIRPNRRTFTTEACEPLRPQRHHVAGGVLARRAPLGILLRPDPKIEPQKCSVITAFLGYERLHGSAPAGRG